MIVSCPKCNARYQYDESRFGDSQSKRLRCSKCSNVFEVVRPQAAPEAEGEAQLTSIGARRRPEDTTKQIELSQVEEEAEKSLPQLAPLPDTRRYSLAVILGANAGQIFPLKQSRIVLGRGVNCDIQLQDSEISRRHAMLEIRGEEATVSDLGSTNGTFFEGTRVSHARLLPHQEFSLGNTTLMFIVTELHDPAGP